MNEENCPMNTSCPVHFRIDGEVSMDDFYQEGVLVSYVGKYAVVTQDDRTAEGLARMLVEVIAGVTPSVPYVQHVLEVGDLCVGDLEGKGDEEVLRSIRNTVNFTGWDTFRDRHNTTVMALREGLLEFNAPNGV